MMRFLKLDLKGRAIKMWATLKATPSRLKSAFIIEDGEKKRLHFWRIIIVVIPLLLSGVFFSIFWPKKDTSYIGQSSERATPQEKFEVVVHGQSRLIQDASKARSSAGSPRIKYSAKQVIDRFQNMPAGTQFIGKLLTAIDTRDKDQTIKVLLPYGGVYQGVRNIESGSTLFGSHQFRGGSDRVFLRFNRLISPDGREFQIRAQALNSKDFSPGLSGELHTNSDSRLLTTVGLSMLSAGTDVLVEKESLGNSFEVTPKSSLKNAAMAGLSDAAKTEAERTAAKLDGEEEYVIVDSGTELIVSLIETFRGGGQQ